MTKEENKIIELYGGKGWVSIFTKIRLWDAPYILAESLITKKGKIIDLGCGYGIFSNFLALKSKDRKILGIELNDGKISRADKGIKNTEFKAGDIRNKEIPKADSIVLMHVLHHLDNFIQQENLIKVCLKKLNTKGELLIIECVKSPIFLFALTRIADFLMYPGDHIYYRDTKEWESLFDKLKLKYDTIPAYKGKPFTHVIFRIKRS